MRKKSVFLLLVLTIAEILSQAHFINIPPVHGVTWSSGISLTPLGSIEEKPYVMEDSQSNLWVAYESNRLVNWTIWMRQFNGISWLPEQQLTSSTSNGLTPALVQLTNGNVMLVWTSNMSGNYSLYYKTYAAGVWSSPARLTTPQGRESTPSLVQLRNGTVLLYWTRESLSGGVVRYIYSKSYNNGAWSKEARFSAGGTELEPSVYQTDDGTIWVVYGANRFGNLDIFYKTYNGSWSSEVRLTTNTADDHQSWLTQDFNGVMWEFWTRCVPLSGGTCEDKIFYITSTDLGATWSAEVQFTFDPTGFTVYDSHPAAIHYDRDKMMYVFWGTDLTGPGVDFDVWLRTSNPIPFHDVAAGPLRLPQDKPRVGENLTVVASIWNAGSFTENVNLTVTVDGAKVGSNLTPLGPWTGATFSYMWRTAGKALGSHQVQAVVAPVPGEFRLSNNVVSAQFSILPQGDTDRDGVVNSLDLGLVGAAFLTKWGDAAFNPQADLLGNGVINSLDLGIVGSTFGQAVVLPPDFSLDSRPYLVRLAQGSSAAVTISINPVSGFASPVFFSAAGFGPGVQATFSASPVTSPGTTTLTLVASSTATLGSSSVVITGAGGVLVRYASFSLVIRPPPSFSLGLGSPSTRLVQGGNALSTVAVSSIGDFGSPVFLSLSGLPAGVNYAFSPNPATPLANGVASVSLNLTATTTAVLGTYAVTVTGNSGTLSSSATLFLTVDILGVGGGGGGGGGGRVRLQ